MENTVVERLAESFTRYVLAGGLGDYKCVTFYLDLLMAANADEFVEFRKFWLLREQGNVELCNVIRARYVRTIPLKEIFDMYCWPGKVDAMLSNLDRYSTSMHPGDLSVIQYCAQDLHPTEFACLVLATAVNRYHWFRSSDLGARRVEVANFLDVELYEEI